MNVNDKLTAAWLDHPLLIALLIVALAALLAVDIWAHVSVTPLPDPLWRLAL